MPNTIDLSECDKVGGDISDFDFVVRCQRPDGSIISVLIPDVLPGHYTRVGQADQEQELYGLNFVCRGHYI